MKYWKAGIIFGVALIIQASLLNLVNIEGYTPDLLLALSVAFSFVYSDELFGIIFGGVFGLLYDIFYGISVGPTAIALVAVAVLIILFKDSMNVDNMVNMWVVSLVSIALYSTLRWALYYISGSNLGFLYMLKTLPWVGLYSLAVITVIYIILMKNQRKKRKYRYFS